MLKELEIEALVEVIDKKYNLSIQMIDNTIKPNLEFKIRYAQWILENLDDEDYKLFLDANQMKSKESFEIYINDLLEILDKKLDYLFTKIIPSEKMINSFVKERDKIELSFETLKKNQKSIEEWKIGKDIKRYLENSFENYKECLRMKVPNPHYKFLPIEDKSKNNKIYSHLPHVNCFTNLVLRGTPLETDVEIEIIHDVQKEFDSILEENLRIVITELDLKHKLKLEFKDSTESKGIQYSDLIAGTVHKIWRDYIVEDNKKAEIKELYEALTDIIIINPVVPTSFIESNEKMQKITNVFFLKEKNNMAQENLKNFILESRALEMMESYE